MDRYRNNSHHSNGEYGGKRKFNDSSRNYSGGRKNTRSKSKSPPAKRIKLESEAEMAPWLSSKTKRIESSLLRFHNEIIEFAMYMLPSPEEHQKRLASFEVLKKLIESNLEGSQVSAFGSFRTKMYLPDGDIDVVVIKEEKLHRLLKKVHKIIAMSQNYCQIEIIPSAKVPIIKLTEKSTKFDFDISFNKPDGVAQLEEFDKAMKFYPEMKYMLIVLKCMLKLRELNETYKGGIGSFLLFCMILAFLREFRRDYKGSEKELSSILLSEYLLQFLQFFGQKFEYQMYRIDLGKGGRMVRKAEKDGSFSLINPQDPTHDVGGSSFKARDAFNMFKNRFNFLENYNYNVRESILKYLVTPPDDKFFYLKNSGGN